MNSLAFFSLLAGALQLSIPPYALRLIRRFGVQQVGWFLVSAFACLGLLHLLEPLRILRPTFGSIITLDAIYAIGSVLLLIGMAHVETMVSARLQAAKDEKALHRKLDVRIEQSKVALLEANDALTKEVARCAEKEKALAESEARYRFLFIQNPQPMWIVDLRSFRFLAVNKTALLHYGFTEPEFMALGAPGLLSPEASAAFVQNLAKPCFGAELRGRWPLRKKDGSSLHAEITAVDLKYGDCPARLVLATDISARQRHEQQLLERQKFEVIDKIAGGVAHHFNNILTVVSGHTDVLMEGRPGEEIAGQLNNIATAVHRGTCLTRQLLAAGGRQALNLAPLNLNDAIQRSIPTLRRLLGEAITQQSCLASGLPAVMADARAIENIIIALVLNARDAMAGPGTLTLITKAVRITEAEARQGDAAPAEEFVRLSVCDTGRGMPPDVQARLFEPFFTTKDIGKAAGMGLASVRGLVKQHSGSVQCVSEVGKGTEIHIFLPCAPQSTAKVEASATVPTTRPARETVLLVEPDDRARALGRFILNRQGYVVIEADSASLALSLWQSQHARIAIVITEISLSDSLSGPRLVEQLRAIKPDVKAIYTCNPDTNPPMLPGQHVLLPKPYTVNGLIKKVEQLLAAN